MPGDVGLDSIFRVYLSKTDKRFHFVNITGDSLFHQLQAVNILVC